MPGQNSLKLMFKESISLVLQIKFNVFMYYFSCYKHTDMLGI